jgi:hypothetical protein
MEQIAPEQPGLDSRSDILLDRRHKAKIDKLFACVANTANFSCLEQAKQLRLSFDGKARKLVKKQRAPGRLGDETSSVLDSPGKGSPTVPEEHAFDHVSRQRTAVDVDKLSPPLAQRVEMPCEKFLPSAGRPDEEHGHPASCKPLQPVCGDTNGGGAPENRRESGLRSLRGRFRGH